MTDDLKSLPQEMEKAVHAALPEASVALHDLTGNGDHFEVNVVWEGFQGRSRLERHRTVMALLDPLLKSGRLHAVKIMTYTESEL